MAGRGQYDEAIISYRKALAIKPDFADAHNNLGVALVSGGKPVDEAIMHFRKALELKPNYEGARQNLERVISGRGGGNEAGGKRQEGLARDSGALVNLGDTLARRGEVDEAIVQYRKAVGIDREYDGALNNVGLVLACRGLLEDALIH